MKNDKDASPKEQDFYGLKSKQLGGKKLSFSHENSNSHTDKVPSRFGLFVEQRKRSKSQSQNVDPSFVFEKDEFKKQITFNTKLFNMIDIGIELLDENKTLTSSKLLSPGNKLKPPIEQINEEENKELK